jgi:Fur family peroxide stress response transcriptional regulator
MPAMTSTAGARRTSPRSAERVDEMLASLRASGLKLTPQRLAIVRELADDPTHPTAQELFERLRPAMPTMSFATVYNTLDALASAGLCVALSLAPGASRFDPNMRPHHHAVCDRCGLVRDVAVGAEGDDAVPATPGFEVRSVERIYRGLCAACAAEPALIRQKISRAPRA